jgi:hypothetical protein
MTIHGLADSREYYIWANMKRRCYRPKCKCYKHYGGRGVKVCDDWLSSFQSFYRDMGPRPSPKHTLDRINGDGNYEPGNCRWTTQSVQIMNRKKRLGTSSKYRGVCMKKGTGKFIAAIKHNGKQITLGTFSNEIDAAKEYNSKALEIHGSLAVLNEF